METMINLTPLIEAVIALLAAVITMHLIPWLREKFSAEQLQKARMWVEVGVYAAEKAYGAGNGDSKLVYVEGLLRQKGIKLDTMALKALVDAEIKKMEQSEKGGLTIIEQIGEGVLLEEEETEDEEAQPGEA